MAGTKASRNKAGAKRALSAGRSKASQKQFTLARPPTRKDLKDLGAASNRKSGEKLMAKIKQRKKKE